MFHRCDLNGQFARGVQWARPTAGVLFIVIFFAMAKAPAELPAVAQPLILCGKSSRAEAHKISPFITEVIRLVDAKVDAAVIKAYIHNAQMTYNPTAMELITLQQHGAGTETLLALVQRAAEAGTRTSPSLPTAPSAILVPVYRYAPQTAYQTAPESYAVPSERSYPTNYEVSAGSPIYYAVPAYYTGVGGLPGIGPGVRRPPLREEHGQLRSAAPASNSGVERASHESPHSGFAPPAAHVAPTSAHSAAPHPPGRGGG